MVDHKECQDRITLEDAIADLRKQLASATAAAPKDKAARFRITEVELELSVVADDSASGGGEVGWWILKARADLAVKHSLSHKIRLKLDVGQREVGDQTETR